MSQAATKPKVRAYVQVQIAGDSSFSPDSLIGKNKSEAAISQAQEGAQEEYQEGFCVGETQGCRCQRCQLWRARRIGRRPARCTGRTSTGSPSIGIKK